MTTHARNMANFRAERRLKRSDTEIALDGAVKAMLPHVIADDADARDAADWSRSLDVLIAAACASGPARRTDRTRTTFPCPFPGCVESMSFEPAHPAERDTGVAAFRGGYSCTNAHVQEFDEDGKLGAVEDLGYKNPRREQCDITAEATRRALARNPVVVRSERP